MPRKARSYDRHLPKPDAKYSNSKYGKFINYIMERGKKSVAQKIFYQAIDEVTKKVNPAGTPDDKIIAGTAVFEQALKNISPLVEIKGRRIGGANYQVPMEVVEPRKTALGMKWLIGAAKSRKGAPMHIKLSAEIVDAYNKVGAAMKKRDDTHRMAEANKAFAHFARFNKR